MRPWSYPWASPSHFFTCVIIYAISALIIFGIALLSIWALSKIRPASSKSQVDGLIGGGISLLIPAFVICLDKVLHFAEFDIGSDGLIFLLIPLPMVLFAASLTKNKWKGIVVGCLVYFVMFLVLMIIAFCTLPMI
jgi:hypothetical protein